MSESERDGGGSKGFRSDILVPASEQADLAAPFLDGLVAAFEVAATVERVEIDEETIEFQINGTDLGVLVGPKGSTIQAIQELMRAAILRQVDGKLVGRVRVDVAGYRAKRREALERFVTDLAHKVAESGERLALEPMNPPDRKVVHDVVNDIDGVSSVSEGEEPRRRVVIVPS